MSENEFWAELERRDVVFRMKVKGPKKPPFFIGSDGYKEEIDEILENLRSGNGTLDDAIQIGTAIMERYYGVTYK